MSVKRNIGYLGISQAANYVLPLVTLPYITRVVGPENYGIVEFATVTMLYLSVIVTYGFTFTSTRKIAELGDDFKRISTVYSASMQAKLLLLLLSAAVFGILLLAIPQYQSIWKVMLFAFPVVIGWAIYPDFLFQGRQKLGVIATVNLGIKMVGAALIFILLQEKSDFYLVLGINSITQIVASVLTLWYGHRIYPDLKFTIQPNRIVKRYLKNGFDIFVSHFLTRVYTFGTILFLGFLLPEKELGLFSAAMKLIVVGQSFLFNPIGGALYPHLAKLAKTDLVKYDQTRVKYQWMVLGLTALGSGVIIVFSPFFVNLLFGAEYLTVVPILRWMSPVLVLTTFSHFAMKQGLMVLKADRYNLWVVFIAGVGALVLNYVLIQAYGLYGAAWAKLGVEVLLTVSAAYFFRIVWKEKLASRK